jgi:protein-S-isoprenylcysteine O-methyltransferase Ste14
MQWFRRARPATFSWNLAKTAIQVVIFWSLFLFVIPRFIDQLGARLGMTPGSSPSGRVAAALLFVMASACGLWSAATMALHGRGTPLPLDAPRELVLAGPYAWVRNPMAVAGLAQGCAVAVWHGSVAVAIYVLAGGFLWHVVVRPREEADLNRRFGVAYEQYRRHVPLWVPRVSPWRQVPRG